MSSSEQEKTGEDTSMVFAKEKWSNSAWAYIAHKTYIKVQPENTIPVPERFDVSSFEVAYMRQA
jgi:hypothetical protein